MAIAHEYVGSDEIAIYFGGWNSKWLYGCLAYLSQIIYLLNFELDMDVTQKWFEEIVRFAENKGQTGTAQHEHNLELHIPPR